MTIRVRIEGERPETLTELRETNGKRRSEVVPVDGDAEEVEYAFRDIQQTTTYAVRGGDFTSPYYRIDVPTPSLLAMARVRYQFPDYTRLPEKSVECAGGDLEALAGTVARITFVMDRDAESAALLLYRHGAEPQRQPLEALSPREFAGEIVFRHVTGYQLETSQPDQAPHRSNSYALRIHKDQPPKLELRGLERTSEATPDAVLPLSLVASDDYGLAKVGLF